MKIECGIGNEFISIICTFSLWVSTNTNRILQKDMDKIIIIEYPYYKDIVVYIHIL